MVWCDGWVSFGLRRPSLLACAVAWLVVLGVEATKKNKQTTPRLLQGQEDREGTLEVVLRS